MKNHLYILILIVSGLIYPFSLCAQIDNKLLAMQDTLVRLSKEIWKAKDDSSKIQANKAFLSKYKEVLTLPSAFNFPFDSLATISRLKSDDAMLRITTWNIPLNNGTYKYFGFIELKNGKVFNLVQAERRDLGWENKILSLDHWYGAIYYKLISQKVKKEYVYTLIGWDGNDESSNYKLIDILSFDSNGIPVFGKGLFKTSEGIKNRVLIEYAKNTTALVRYDNQSLKIQKGNRVKEKKMWMIVMDKLIPMMPSMTGIRKYYVPSGDTHDAYLFRDGFWTFVENISAGNSALK
ncbi:MAG: hypothetical protein HXX13_01560 [Bacteroidetes bacterium]|nr:hypothetical protein [Bacteroidota bacterium]